MSKYRVLATDSNELFASFDSYNEARDAANEMVDLTGKETCVVEVKSTYSPVIDSYEAAKTYLGGDAKNHRKALIALEKLIVIAEACNKQDGFVPDFSNLNQYKWFPSFGYNDKAAGFVYDESYTDSVLGSRLCFKTEARAEQFGKQFIDLWNDFLLYR